MCFIPGFIMAMTEMMEVNLTNSRGGLARLSGNLCRCADYVIRLVRCELPVQTRV